LVAKPITAQEFAQLLTPFNLPDDKIGVAVSGGPESMALAYLLSSSYPAAIHAFIVDHGLRPESTQEAKTVKKHLSAWPKITPHILRWSHEKPTTRVLERARAARFELLSQACLKRGIGYLLLAHHQDDQAETFLFRLAKGSGLDGLAAMRPRQIHDSGLELIRPFLSVPKERLIATCDKYHIPFITDPSNTNTKFARPRLRQSAEILANEGLTPKRLALTAKRLYRATQALDFFTEKYLAETIVFKDQNLIILNYHTLMDLPQEVLFRIILKSIDTLHPEKKITPRMENLENLVWDLCNTQNFRRRSLGNCLFSRNLLGKQHGIIIERE
jgi:tRNA(Ile)-lysidine synthase